MNLTSVSDIAAGCTSGMFSPLDVVREVYRRITSGGRPEVWIHLVPQEQAEARATQLMSRGLKGLPLPGVPLAVKDNIDVAGMPTTAACPAFAYTPSVSAPVVRRLLDAGAICIGKTNMDQFATGLVGTRSPHGAARNVFDDRYISGGSSSGSAVAVAAKLVSFSLGTDTAGSGRVPAAFNGIVGLKPTRGRLSMTGVVPACRSLDCVSVFAHTVDDAEFVCAIAAGPTDQARIAPPAQFRFGVPRPDQLDFFGDAGYAALYRQAVARLESIGGKRVEIDYAPFRETAELLYAGPWVAERLAAIGEFMRTSGDAMDPTVRAIIAGGARYSAVDTFKAFYKLDELKGVTAKVWGEIDVLALPTTPTIYTIDQVAAEPVKLNTNLGYYTNFMNLLDLCGLALPAGFRADGLPFGITLAAPAHHEPVLGHIGRAFVSGITSASAVPQAPTVHLAVVGAHLAGMPLNGQLTSRGARLVKTTRTAPAYKFYALANSTPPKPGLVHVGQGGAGIEVEVWELSEQAFGSFVAAVPPPLAIGTLELEDGSQVRGFVAEPRATAGATDITHHGGWRRYIASLKG